MIPTLTFDIHALMQVVFYILMLFFMIYALFLGHHWFTYGADKKTSTIAMATYLGGGAILFMTLAASIRLL